MKSAVAIRSLPQTVDRKLVDHFIQNDRWTTQKCVINYFGVYKERVSLITELEYCKICAWVRLLRDENEQRQLECCKQFLKRYRDHKGRSCNYNSFLCGRDEGDYFLLNSVMGNELSVHHYNPEEKRQSSEYQHPSSHSKKFNTQVFCKDFFWLF